MTTPPLSPADQAWCDAEQAKYPPPPPPAPCADLPVCPSSGASTYCTCGES